MGRPIEYRENYIQKAEDYIARCGREATELPTREGLAILLDCDDETLIEWGKKNELFSATLKKLDYSQKNQLMNDGLYGGKEVNAGMAIFLLKANHGLIETSRTELTGKDGKPLPILPNVQPNNSDNEDKKTE